MVISEINNTVSHYARYANHKNVSTELRNEIANYSQIVTSKITVDYWYSIVAHLSIYTPKGINHPNIAKQHPKGYKYNIICYICTLKGIGMVIANFVKAKRKAVNLTQPELAEKAGVGLRFIRELEQGKESMRLDKVNQVLQLFGYEVGPVIKPKEDNS